jgi:hypothetical protein
MWNAKSLNNVRSEKGAEKVRRVLYIQYTFTQDLNFWGDNFIGDMNAPALLRCAGVSGLWPSALRYICLYVARGSARYHRLTTTSLRNLTTTFYDLYQWLHMQFLELLVMGAKSTRNM